MMHMIPVLNSTNINEIGFDPDTNTLRVQFKTGAEYEYEGVSQETFNQFRDAPSAGKFFHQRIKGLFPARKVKDAEED